MARIVITDVPGWCAIIVLGNIVVSLAVPAHEEHFVVTSIVTCLLQTSDLRSKLLPLG